MKTTRRKFIKNAAQSTAIVTVGSSLVLNSVEAWAVEKPVLQFNQIDLPYGFNALEPNIDTLTMEIHYGKWLNDHFSFVDEDSYVALRKKIGIFLTLFLLLLLWSL